MNEDLENPNQNGQSPLPENRSTLGFFDEIKRLRLKQKQKDIKREAFWARVKRILLGGPRLIFNWFKVSEPRWKTVLVMLVLGAFVLSTFFASPGVGQAATFTWTQTNWNSQTSTTTGHPAPADWTQYTSKDASVSTGASLTTIQDISYTIKSAGSTNANGYCLSVTTCWIADGRDSRTENGSGVLKKTTDGGANWSFQTIPVASGPTSAMADIMFVDANNGYMALNKSASNNTDYVNKTTDGGSTWTQLTVPNNGDGRSLWVFDSNTVVVANSTIIIRTTDGGANWTTVSGSCNTGIRTQMYFVPSTTTGYVVGSGGKICKSINNGASWIVTNSPNAGASLNDVFFVNADTGWIIGDGGLVYKTSNGGTNWTVETATDNDNLTSITCADANTCWIGKESSSSSRPTLIKTTDGGTTWSTTGVTDPLPRISVLTLQAFDTNTVIATLANGGMAKSTDGGATWTMMYHPLGGSTTNFLYTGVNTMILNRNNGTTQSAYITTDDGATWTKTTDYPSSVNVISGFFLNTTIGWIWGDRNEVLLTTNGGASWTVVEDMSGAPSRAKIKFLNSSDGYEVDNVSAGVVRKTTNGGDTWLSIPGVGSNLLENLFFLDVNTGWVVGASGTIYKTTNGGSNWSAQTSNTTNQINAIQCTDSTHCWAVGASGTILVTTNGGTTWSAQTSNTSNNLNDLYFQSSTHGVAVGDDNKILYTTNGGTTWSTLATANFGNQALDFVNVSGGDTGVFYVSGQLGVVLKVNLSYPVSASLTSSAFDSGDASNVIASVAWTEDASLPTGTTVTLSVRTASSSAGLSGSWTDFTNATSGCSKASGTVTCPTNAIPSALKDGSNDRWFQYKITFGSTGANTATVSDVTLQYVVNTPPTFDTDYPTEGAGGVSAVQITDPEDSNFNKVAISYRVKDGDTDTGSSTPGFVTPSFQYNIGAGWITITSGFLAAGDLNNKAVDDANYTTYTAYWDAAAQIPDNFLETAKVRVTVNDNEGANNTATATSANFTLDTGDPVISAFKLDASNDTLTISVEDDNNLSYRISNNSDFSADGENETAGEWQEAGGTSISITPDWVFAAVPNHPTVYLQVRDEYGNVSQATAVGPSVLSSSAMFIKDISNTEAERYSEFISWEVYTNFANAAFSKYEVYRSTDNSTYELIATVEDRNTNYYADFDLEQGLTYYYKVRVVDTETDKGPFSSVVNDLADGQGGSDATPPAISSITVANTQSTYATITWTTDELSDSRVDFSVSPDTTFDSGQAVSSFVLNHSVTLTNLTPNTTYLFRVKSTDVTNNVTTDDNDGSGYSFTTTAGPIISGVTEKSVGEHSATIFWTTNVDSDSHVTYSTNADLSDSTIVGSNALVGGSSPYQHTVVIPDLESNTTYYYSVSSEDAENNVSTDTNSGNYYTFTTTNDNMAPVISDIATPVIAPTAAVIVWQTDELASTQLLWGETSGELDTTTELNSTLTIFHVVSLTDLEEATTYYFKVRSTDEAGNESTSEENEFTTGETTIIQQIVGGGGGGGNAVVQDTTPPKISEVKVANIQAFSADVSFTTDEDSVGLVKFSTDEKSLSQGIGVAEYLKDHSATLSGLKMGTKYFIQAFATDKSGNTATSEIQNFTTGFFTEGTINADNAEQFQEAIEEAIQSALPTLVPPFIERPEVSEVTDTSATIKWKTNVKAYSALSYAPQGVYDSTKEDPYGTQISEIQTKSVDHQLTLNNLIPNTVYHFAIKAFSLPQVVGSTQDLTFTTRAPKITAQISNVTNNSFEVAWRTTEPATSVVEYRNTRTNEVKQSINLDQTTLHSMIVTGLTPGSSYEVSVFGTNSKGNRIETASAIVVQTSVDTKAPEITGLKIDTALIPGSSDKTQTIISWKTDEDSTSTVFYEEGSGSGDKPLANKVEITNSFVRDHAVVLSTLKPGGVYRIQVSSTDEAGNKTDFPIRTVVVARQSQSILDVIFKNFEDTFNFLKR